MKQAELLKSVSVVRVELVRDSESEYAAVEVKYPERLVEVVRRFLGNADREVFLAVNLDDHLGRVGDALRGVKRMLVLKQGKVGQRVQFKQIRARNHEKVA